MRIVVPPGGRRRWNRAGPGRSTDRTKVTGVVAPVGRAYLDLALSLCLSLSSPLLFTPLLRRIHTNTHTHTYESHGAQFRSVPFVRYERTYPVPFLSSSPLPSSHLASPRLSPPLTPSPRSLSWLRQPRYALLPQTQPRFNPDFVSNKRWIRGIYNGLYGK